MELILMATLVVLNGGYIYYLHRRLHRLAEANRAQAAADRRLVVTALEVSGELRAVTADFTKQAEIVRKQYENLNCYLTKLLKSHYSIILDGDNGNGRRPKGQAAGARPGNGTGRREQPDAYV
jgi:DNA replication protein DnaC